MLPEKELILPPVTVTSPDARVVVFSLLVNVTLRVASFVVLPLETELPPLFATVIATDGLS